ncbi:MAG: hypothetical protein ABH828_05640 [archaeon]
MMRTILFQKTIEQSRFDNNVSFSNGLMVHRQIEHRDGFVFMRLKKRRLIH